MTDSGHNATASPRGIRVTPAAPSISRSPPSPAPSPPGSHPPTSSPSHSSPAHAPDRAATQSKPRPRPRDFPPAPPPWPTQIATPSPQNFPSTDQTQESFQTPRAPKYCARPTPPASRQQTLRPPVDTTTPTPRSNPAAAPSRPSKLPSFRPTLRFQQPSTPTAA